MIDDCVVHLTKREATQPWNEHVLDGHRCPLRIRNNDIGRLVAKIKERTCLRGAAARMSGETPQKRSLP
jgi:hypothetical protein